MARRILTILWVLAPAIAAAGQTRPADPAVDVVRAAKAVLSPLQGDQPYTLDVEAKIVKKDASQEVGISISTDGRGAAAVRLRSPWVDLRLVRTPERLMLLLPTRRVAFVGQGPATKTDAFLLSRLGPRISTVLSKAAGGLPLLLMAAGVEPLDSREAGVRAYAIGRHRGIEGLTARIDAAGGKLIALRWEQGKRSVDVRIRGRDRAELDFPETTGIQTVAVRRAELETTLARAVVRAVGILYNDLFWVPPGDTQRTVAGGKLIIRGGNRVVLLAGTPEQIGMAHARLLAPEARRLIDSTLHVVGLFYSLQKGRWFLDDLRAARKRLWPHLPEEYKQEMAGFARGAHIPIETVELANQFPELFHCSGFAVFGSATADGKLYHGRVLDYMTRIGLQRSAAVFVVKKPGRLAFANVGYAGFLGSVSGMNEKQVAIGEMGGRGEGNWDGMPMSFLVRYALETCPTLDEACRLFEKTPRTCEYYYVFSDGKIRDARGVAATPEQIVFLKPGQSHPRLPRAIRDVVLMSAGRRYDHLADRVEQQFGQIDEHAAIALMKRPVAMKSNLHDVLFVPEDLVFYVANASARRPACDQPYAKYDLKELIAALPAGR